MAYDFPNSPALGQVFQGYTYDGEKWISTSSASNASALTKKNYIINGAMMVSQENGSTALTVSGSYPADMFRFDIVGGAISAAQVASLTPAGSPNRVRITVTTPNASPAAGDYCLLGTNVEGLRAADLKSGTAVAKIITVQFGVKAPAGAYCMSLHNAANNRTYLAEYVIASGEANTDVVKSVTLTLDTTGTWAADNTIGLMVTWGLVTGSTYRGVLGWQAGNFFSTTNQFNFMATGGNVFELFDVSLTEGTDAPPFVVPDLISELAACQRYFLSLNPVIFFPVSGFTYNTIVFPTTMRATPAVTALPDSGMTGCTFQASRTSMFQNAGGTGALSGGTAKINARV